MKRIRRVGLGAIAGAVATAAAFLLHPRSGARRRAAVRRGGGSVARRGASVANLIGRSTWADRSRRRTSAADEALQAGIEAALLRALGGPELPLTVMVAEGVATVRGEVDSLDQIGTVSRALDRFQATAEIVNLVRLRAGAEARTTSG